MHIEIYIVHFTCAYVGSTVQYIQMKGLSGTFSPPYRHGQFNCVRILLEKGAQIAPGRGGTTPIMLCAQVGQLLSYFLPLFACMSMYIPVAHFPLPTSLPPSPLFTLNLPSHSLSLYLPLPLSLSFSSPLPLSLSLSLSFPHLTEWLQGVHRAIAQVLPQEN